MILAIYLWVIAQAKSNVNISKMNKSPRKMEYIHENSIALSNPKM